MESLTKVNAKIQELNRQTGNIWIAVNGYNVMPYAEVKAGEFQFHGNVGFVAKLFLNTNTGEIRVFPYTLFEQ